MKRFLLLWAISLSCIAQATILTTDKIADGTYYVVDGDIRGSMVYELPQDEYEIVPRPSGFDGYLDQVEINPYRFFSPLTLGEAIIDPLTLNPLQWLSTNSTTTVIDQTTNGYDASLNDAPCVKGRDSGVSSRAVQWTTPLLPATNDFTASFSLMATDVTAYMIPFGHGVAGNGFHMDTSGSSLRVRFWGTTMETWPLTNNVATRLTVVRESGDFTFYQDGVETGTYSSLTTNDVQQVNFGMGFYDASSQNLLLCNVWDLDIDGVVKCAMGEGAGNKVYDSTGNGNHGTVKFGSGGEAESWDTQSSYHGSLLNGYSLYEHASSDPIYVQYGTNGSPITLTPPAGYSKTYDVAEIEIHNNAPSLVIQTDNAFTNNSFWYDSGYLGKSGTDFAGHTNWNYNVIVVGTGATNINDVLTFTNGWTIPNYNGMVDWLGEQGSTVPILSPLTDTNGNYIIDVDGFLIFPSP